MPQNLNRRFIRHTSKGEDELKHGVNMFVSVTFKGEVDIDLNESCGSSFDIA
jgi:hypothetical protein